MTGEDLDTVAELDEPPQRVEEAFGPLDRLDREIGTCRVADEQRVAGEHEPRLVGARAVGHRERAVLRPVPRRMQRADDDLAQLDLGAILQRLVRERCAGCRVNPYGQPVLEREPAVPREVVGVRMCLENLCQLDAVSPALIQILLDRIGRIDDDRNAGLLVADEVGGTPEVVVDELLEQHDSDASNECGYIS